MKREKERMNTVWWLAGWLPAWRCGRLCRYRRWCCRRRRWRTIRNASDKRSKVLLFVRVVLLFVICLWLFSSAFFSSFNSHTYTHFNFGQFAYCHCFYTKEKKKAYGRRAWRVCSNRGFIIHLNSALFGCCCRCFLCFVILKPRIAWPCAVICLYYSPVQMKNDQFSGEIK